ncbi:MAG: hypothetical protein IJW40_01545 [Clostridia bacterium]|nr:hypothetical protein [Clostridia bacterium]
MQQQIQPISEQIHDAVGTPDAESAMMAQAEEQNARNAQCAAGPGGSAPPEYLTPAQVRAMDRREVRDHYALIIESMKHWQ